MSSVTYFCPCPNPLTDFYSDSDKQSDPHDAEDTASSDLSVDRDSSGGSSISTADGYSTTSTSNTLPSLKYPDNWVRTDNESSIYKATVIVLMSFFIAAAVCCCIAVAVLWRRRRKRAKQLARKRDLEKSRSMDVSDDEYNEMDGEGGSEIGCCDRRAGETKDERRRRRKAELAAARSERGRDEEDDEETREKKRWARATARWKAHVRWIRRRKTGNKRILDNMMQREAASSCVSFLPPPQVDDDDEAWRSATGRRQSVVGATSDTDRLASSSSPSSLSVQSGSSVRSRTTSASSASLVPPCATTRRSSSPPVRGLEIAQNVVGQPLDEEQSPSDAGPRTRREALTFDTTHIDSTNMSQGSQTNGFRRPSNEFATFPSPPTNPRSGSRRIIRASVDSACTYDRPPPNSPPGAVTIAAHGLSAAGSTTATDSRSLTGARIPSGLDPELDETRNSSSSFDDPYQRPPAYRSRWRETRIGHISEGDDVYEYSDDESAQRRARRSEKSASGSGHSGYVSHVPGGAMFGDDEAGLNALHVATDDKHALARLTEAASAPPATLPPPSCPSDSFPPLPTEDRDSELQATAPTAPNWEDEATFYDNLDSPGAGPSCHQPHQVLSSILPAPPKPVSSSLAFPTLSPLATPLPSFSTHDSFDSASSAGAAAISGKPRGVFGESSSAHPGPSGPPALSTPSRRGMAHFNRFTFAEEELLAGAEPEAGPSAPPFSDDDAGIDADFSGEASAPPLFEDDEEILGDEGAEELSQEHSMTTSPPGVRTPYQNSGENIVQERPDLASAVK